MEKQEELKIIYKDFITGKIKQSNDLADLFNNVLCCKICKGSYGNGYCNKHSSSGQSYIDNLIN